MTEKASKMVINPSSIPENFLHKPLLDKVAKQLSKISLNEEFLESAERVRIHDSSQKKPPVIFTFQEEEEKNEEEGRELAENENEYELQPVQNEADLIQIADFSVKKSFEKENIARKPINTKEESVNQKVFFKNPWIPKISYHNKLLKKITELSEERKILDFDRLYHVTKDKYSKAQLFLELLLLMRQDMIIMNQTSPFGKITFGIV